MPILEMPISPVHRGLTSSKLENCCTCRQNSLRLLPSLSVWPVPTCLHVNNSLGTRTGHAVNVCMHAMNAAFVSASNTAKKRTDLPATQSVYTCSLFYHNGPRPEVGMREG